MKCGQTVYVKDQYGTYAARFVTICHDRFIMITTGIAPGNGMILPDWHAVLRELISYTVPGRLVEKMHIAEGTNAAGMFTSIRLAYPLSVKGLADLLDAGADEVRAELKDLAVAHD